MANTTSSFQLPIKRELGRNIRRHATRDIPIQAKLSVALYFESQSVGRKGTGLWHKFLTRTRVTVVTMLGLTRFQIVVGRIAVQRRLTM